MTDESAVWPRLSAAQSKLTAHFHTYLASWFIRDDTRSDQAVTLMVPLAPKDLERARRSIPLISARLAHPIDRVVVVSPGADDIQELCVQSGYAWIDELEPLSRLCGDGPAREMNGWIRQQMLKLAAPEVVGADRVIAFDSDTYPLRPTRFLDDREKSILYTSERTREPYGLFTQRLTGLRPFQNRSFVAHCMLFERRHLAALRALIEEQRREPWQQAVMRLVAEPIEQAGIMSEFDIYGTFLARRAPDQIVLRDRANVKVGEAEFLKSERPPWSKRRFRFVSSHIRKS